MIRSAQVLVFLVLHLFVLVVCAVALIDAARRPAGAFTAAGKRTKKFWVGITAGATAVAFVGVPPPLGIGAFGFLVVVAAVAGIVYNVDVKPAVAPYSGGPGAGGRPRRGGW